MIQNNNLPSFCTSNFNVIKSLIIFAKYNNLPILLESTSNQVNQYGGYTFLKPKQFVKKVTKIAKELKFKNKIIFGADHLGPLPWKHLEMNEALKNSRKLFKDVIEAGYKKIHIDTGVKLKGDKSLSKNIIIERCKNILNSINKKKIKNIYFVFGTEVPLAGGSNHYKIKNTNIKSIKKDIEYYKKFNDNFSLVIEPGMGFTNQKIHKLKNIKLLKIKKISEKNNFTYEAHSSDYQTLHSLKRLVKNNFKFLKVGPELTYNYMKAILNMEKIEKITFKSNLSEIKKIFIEEMNDDKTFWNQYYSGNKKKIEYLKFNSYLDRSRYYWNKKKINNSLIILKKNINSLNNKSLFKNNKKLNIKKKLKLDNFDFFIYQKLIRSYSKYYSSCNFKLKKKF